MAAAAGEVLVSPPRSSPGIDGRYVYDSSQQSSAFREGVLKGRASVPPPSVSLSAHALANLSRMAREAQAAKRDIIERLGFNTRDWSNVPPSEIAAFQRITEQVSAHKRVACSTASSQIQSEVPQWIFSGEPVPAFDLYFKNPKAQGQFLTEIDQIGDCRRSVDGPRVRVQPRVPMSDGRSVDQLHAQLARIFGPGFDAQRCESQSVSNPSAPVFGAPVEREPDLHQMFPHIVTKEGSVPLSTLYGLDLETLGQLFREKVPSPVRDRLQSAWGVIV